MRFNSHDKMSLWPTSRLGKTLMFICWVMFFCIFGLAASTAVYYGHSVLAGLLMILLFVALNAIVIIPLTDMDRAYFEINGDKITAVDYYFCIRREKTLHISDIASVSIMWGSTLSFKMKGDRLNMVRVRYIVCFDRKSKYLFKVVYTPETEALFGRFFKLISEL